MRAGELRHRVVIQQKVASRNSYGEEVIAWEEVATVWAAVEPLEHLAAGREFIEAERMGAALTTRIRMRYRPGISPAMRAVWGPHTYDIKSVVERGGRRRELWLLCRELVV